jgi:CRISPR-associated exonuclease Cas4
MITARAALKAREEASLPEGKVLYSDTGREEQPARTLVSWRYGLKGRPDYIIETAEGMIPVELKSAACPRSGRPYDSHVMQLICYCLLCEEVMNVRVPFGIIRYRDREVRVNYTRQLRARLLSLLEEMWKARESESVHRNHSQARRCARCGFNEVCGEALHHT